jgi:ribose-phosphate pyrophosphokinase
MERAKIALFSGRAHPDLGAAVAAELGVEPGRCILETFPDHEFRVQILEAVEGRQVFILQPTGPPAAKHFLELMLMADACRRAGASRVIAVVPYFGYARQDRRAHSGEPVGARLMAELMEQRIDRLVTVDLHTPSIEGFFRIPVEHLSAISLLAEAIRPELSPASVVVAPDLGAVKIARRYAELFDLPVAYVDKARLSGGKVRAREVVGKVEARLPLLVDDMITTGGTMLSAMKALLDKGCLPRFAVAATHGLLVGNAVQELASFAISSVVLSDSIAMPDFGALPVRVISLQKALAHTIQRLDATGP